MGGRFSRVEQLEHRVQMLLGIVCAQGLLPFEFKPAHAVGDVLIGGATVAVTSHNLGMVTDVRWGPAPSREGRAFTTPNEPGDLIRPGAD
jgi:hypothetical protein